MGAGRPELRGTFCGGPALTLPYSAGRPTFPSHLGTRSATGGESRPGRVVSQGPVGTQANNRCMDTSLGYPLASLAPPKRFHGAFWDALEQKFPFFS